MITPADRGIQKKKKKTRLLFSHPVWVTDHGHGSPILEADDIRPVSWVMVWPCPLTRPVMPAMSRFNPLSKNDDISLFRWEPG